MSYIESNLMPNEQVVVRGKTHIFLVIRPLVMLAVMFCMLVLAILIMVSEPNGLFALLAFAMGFIGFFGTLGAVAGVGSAILAYMGNEVAVTNRRVIGKFGVIRRSTLEFPFSQIESIAFDQGIVDRLIGAAQIKIRGAGTAWVQTPILANFKAFRHAALEQLETHRSRGGSPLVTG